MASKLKAIVCAVAVAAAPACAYPKTARLSGWGLSSGYRFTRTDSNTAARGATLRERREALDRADRLFVVLSFSGGGTRAAALAYGVLAQLQAVKLHLDGNGDPVLCDDWDAARCRAIERSLLDEVDVISSVSGGSFTSAYYALNGGAIFNPDGPFHKRFLFRDVQGDLFRALLLRPSNWKHLQSRVEIAAKYYQKHIFGDSTFRSLEERPRPYIIINAGDISTGTRFEFTQDQFDLLCGDLSAFPVARAVAASSAFPGLLNSMTVDSHNGADPSVSPCNYSGPGSPAADEDATWVEDVLKVKHLERRRYRGALALKEYRDTRRKHLHLVDGGLSDNVGLRAVSEALASGDRLSQPWTSPDELNFVPDAGRLVGGWSLQQLLNEDRIGTLVVISVNARTASTRDWDTKRKGPSTLAVLKASAGIPMGHFSNETVDRIQEQLTSLLAERKMAGRKPVAAYTFEVAFDDIPDAVEREYFLNLPTSFSLARRQVDCLVSRGPQLLLRANALNAADPDGSGRTFEEVATRDLHGKVTVDPGTAPVCK